MHKKKHSQFFQAPEFEWSPQQKGLVLSTFSYGRLFGPIGGILAGRLGGGTLFGIQILVTALVTLITPFLLYNSFAFFVITNVILGVFEVNNLHGVRSTSICLKSYVLYRHSLLRAFLNYGLDGLHQTSDQNLYHLV